MEIYLIRHTTPEVAQGICYGQTDLDLAPSFEKEYDVLRKKLPSSIDIVYSSPLLRCHTLAGRLGFPLHLDDRLKEYHFGDWEMLPWNDIPQDTLGPWMEDYVNVSSPNGESYQALFNRVKSFWEETIHGQTYDTIALSIHGGVIRSILALLLELPLQNAFRLHIDYGSITKITYKRGTPLVVYTNR